MASMFIPVLAVALALALAGAAVLAAIRGRSGQGGIRTPHRRAAQWAAFTFGASTATAAAATSLATLQRAWPSEPPPLPLLGAMFGVLLYLHVRVLVGDLARWSFFWALQAPERFDRTWRMEVTDIAWGAVGSAGILAAIFSLSALRETSFSFVLIGLCAAAAPLYESLAKPWLQYWRSRRLGDAGHEALETWLAELARRRQIPRFQVRVHDGMEKNAFAMGGLLRNLVVVGGGLASGMSERELKAILAHEIAHVIRRDVPKLVGVVVAGCVAFAFGFVHLVMPNQDDGIRGFLVGMTYVALASPVIYVLLPGFVGRRGEYGADRLAVKLLGDTQPLIDALARLHDLRNVPLDRKGLTHPTGAERIAALEALGRQRSAQAPTKRI